MPVFKMTALSSIHQTHCISFRQKCFSVSSCLNSYLLLLLFKISNSIQKTAAQTDLTTEDDASVVSLTPKQTHKTPTLTKIEHLFLNIAYICKSLAS